MRKVRLSFIGLLLAAAVCPAQVTITEYPARAFSDPYGITAGPDGALWFTEFDPNWGNRIGRVTTAGTVSEYLLPPLSDPVSITPGSDGALWFAGSSVIGRITTAGAISEYPVSCGCTLNRIAAGPDGALWFTSNVNTVGKITTAGVITQYVVPTPDSFPIGIAAGPDGALWFTERQGNKIGRITTAGAISEYPLPAGSSTPLSITAGPDRALWFTESGKIGRITTAGATSEYPVPGGISLAITAGPDGALWFTEGSGKVGRITTAGIIAEYVIPTPDSLPLGIAAGPDGAVWFTEYYGYKIGKIGIGPAAPTNLQANQIGCSSHTGCSGTQIQLTWNYGSSPIDGFIVERQTPQERLQNTWDTVALTPSMTTQGSWYAIDTTVTPFATYNYRVRAYQGAIQSDNSNEDACFQLNLQTLMNNIQMLALFQPDTTGIGAAAGAFGYDHFNWLSEITYVPNSVTIRNSFCNSINPPPPPVIDPLLGGYCHSILGITTVYPADNLPYYWDEQSGFALVNFWTQHLTPTLNPIKLDFNDLPVLPPTASNPDHYEFSTFLVGVQNSPGSTSVPKFDPLANFTWSTNFKGSGGGVLDYETFNQNVPTVLGPGNIFNVQIGNITSLPPTVQNALVNAGAQGVSTSPYIDHSAPMTAAFLSGPQGTNGWYTGIVTVTLIATDIDGPSDIAATSYRLDGGPATSYIAPFTVSSNGTHTIVFGSVDRALNAETPLPSQSFKIDATPPVIVPQITGTLGNNGWYRSNVAISWSVTDPESGIASSSGCATTTFTTDTAGVTLTCSATNGAGLSSSVPVTIKIDKTPPVISGMPAAGCTFWPPNHTLIQIGTVTATDALSGLSPGSLTVTGTSNEPIDPSDPAIVIAPNGSGGFTIQLQADRLGSGTGRVYSLNATATDLAGNTGTATATCTVPHDQAN